MKKIMMAAVAMVAAVALAQEQASPAPAGEGEAAQATAPAKKTMSLANARNHIAEAIATPAVFADIMRQLSNEDQCAFLAEVNAALDVMQGSPEDKAQLYLTVNAAAMRNAGAGNLQNLLATTFSTVPVEALPAVSDYFGKELFNRGVDPAHPITDMQFVKSASDTLKVIEAATAGKDDAAVRDTLAILMFVKASNGAPENIDDTLLETLPEDVRELAKEEWLPAAKKGDYDAMLGSVDADEAMTAPLEVPITLDSSEGHLALMAELASKNDGSAGPSYVGASTFGLGSVGLPEGMNTIGQLNRIPITQNPDAPWNPDYKRGQEPDGYLFQDL